MAPPNSRKERTEEREQRCPDAFYHICISISTDRPLSAMIILLLGVGVSDQILATLTGGRQNYDHLQMRPGNVK